MTERIGKHNRILYIYGGIGFAFGLCFPVGALLVESIIRETPLTAQGIVAMHAYNPLLYMIDSAPVFLGLFALIGGFSMRRARRAKDKTALLLKEVEVKNASNEQLVSQFEDALGKNEKLRMEIESSGKALVDASGDLGATFLGVAKIGHDVDVEAAAISGAVREVSRISEELETQFEAFTDDTKHMADKMSVCRDEIRDQGSVVDHLDQQIKSLALELRDLGMVAEGVTEVIDLIHKLSEDVKLLALNASIEAARAGDLGKGFAVVATEIQKLSKETDIATDQVAGRVGKVTAGIKEALQVMGQINDESALTNKHNTDLSTRVLEIASLVDAIGSDSREIGQQLIQQGQEIRTIHQMAGDLSGQSNKLRGAIEKGTEALAANDQAIHNMTI